jgi:hypothetical protein
MTGEENAARIAERAEVTEALLAHALVPEPIDGDTDNGTGLMGALESDLLDELQRQWRVWRDELIRAGTTERNASRVLGDSGRSSNGPHRVNDVLSAPART